MEIFSRAVSVQKPERQPYISDAPSIHLQEKISDIFRNDFCRTYRILLCFHIRKTYLFHRCTQIRGICQDIVRAHSCRYHKPYQYEINGSLPPAPHSAHFSFSQVPAIAALFSLYVRPAGLLSLYLRILSLPSIFTAAFGLNFTEFP